MSDGFIIPITGYNRAFAAITATYPAGSTCAYTHSEKGKGQSESVTLSYVKSGYAEPTNTNIDFKGKPIQANG